MPDSLASLPEELPAATHLLPALLELLPAGVVYLTPRPGAAGEVVDFTFAYLNATARRVLKLPGQPAITFVQQFPESLTDGAFAFCLETWQTGSGPGYFELPYSADGHGLALRVEARRAMEGLLLTFPDPASQPRTAPPHSPAPELQALAEAEQQRQQFYQVLMQLPANIVLLQGPNHVIEFVNPSYQQLFSGRALLGQPAFEALPELAGQGFLEVLDRVYQTGESLFLPEAETWANFASAGQLEQRYYNASFLPFRDAQGQITGILNITFDVTAQVAARQQVQQFNEELEMRVTARSAEARAALHEAEYQREQARRQQAWLGQILGQVPAAIATLTGPEHRYTFSNDAYQALSGGRSKAGLSVSEVLPELVEQGFIGLLDEVYATGKPFIGIETPTRLLDPATGQPAPRFLDFIYQPLTDEQGRAQGILAFIVDVTEKVQARHHADDLRGQVQAAIQRQAQEREVFYQVFEQTPALVLLLRSPGHRVEYVNPAYQRLFAGRQLVGLDLAEAVPELQEAGFIELINKVYRTGETYFGVEMPFTVPSADGQLARDAYFTFTYQAYRENGQIAGISVFAYEVTEQVLARYEREAQQLRLHSLFMEAPAAICILDGPSLVFELVNPGYQELFPGRDLLGKPLLEALPEIVGHAVYGTFRQVYDTGATHQEWDIRFPLARPEDGVLEDRYFNYIQQARFNEFGRVDGVLVFAFEVTQQVYARQQVQELNQELAAMNEELQATNAELGDTNTQLIHTNADLDTFVYTASHDLKAPITNIEGLLLALREQLPVTAQQAPLVARILDLMQDAVVRFQQTIAHLADIAQLQYSQAADTVDLAALVADVRLDLAPLLEATHATLTIDLDPEAATLRLAAKTLRSVVYNLLSNALKYRHPSRPPLVALRAYCSAGRVLVAVHDNGLGLTEAQQNQLFGMFRRLHTHVEGSGVGLFMVKRLVENAGGTITVQSQIGVGSTFIVSLPV